LPDCPVPSTKAGLRPRQHAELAEHRHLVEDHLVINDLAVAGAALYQR
jgi:hypothetical protein